MSEARVRVARAIDVPATTAYDVLRDYRRHHPNILPKPTFESLEVEEGGVGEGTLIRVTMRVLGRPRTFRMRVREPEPGRVLAEEDLATGDVTTFTVEPIDGGKRAEVAIETTWRGKTGLAGWIERTVNPRVVRPLYERELANLEAYAQRLA
ncbi:MAG TPA: SRPBCC family protein [Candidatus Thermoplasmatota archaeon]|nr:SRPBCC family protein [Candidatus Thermoplasmatota archaeon]